MKVPFFDLKRQYGLIGEEIDQGIREVLQNTQFILGRNVEAFEEEFARYCNAEYALGVASGTDALALALEALGVGVGDEVITVANTFVATVGAILRNAATPVLVDAHPSNYNIDPTKIEERITKRTRAIIPVHLYGQPVDMAPLLEIARRRGLYVVEDAAQAHGALYWGRKVGSLGDIACFSFYPTKNLGACGDGGAIVTSDRQVAERVRLLRDHGRRDRYHHQLTGHNSRLDEIQAAILRVKLRHLDRWNEARRASAELYTRLLEGVEAVITPQEMDYAQHVYHLYVVRCQERDRLQEWLASKGIGTAIHYPIPVHLQEAFGELEYGGGSFPVAEELAGQILSLPMFPELTQEEVEYVCAALREFYRERKPLELGTPVVSQGRE